MMKHLRIAALALLFATSASAQTGQGTSPLSGPKGGTNNAFMQFTGPASSVKTFTLPNASDTIATLGAVQTLTSKTLTDPFIARVYGGATAGASLQLQSTSSGAPSGDSIQFITSGTYRGGFGGGAFSPHVFHVDPLGTPRLVVNDASMQIGYDVILLGDSQFNSGATGTPNMTWKAPKTGFSDVPFGGILGNNINGSNHAFMIIAASPGGTDNPIEFYTNNGAGSSVRRMSIDGGSATTKVSLSNSTFEVNNNAAALPSLTSLTTGGGIRVGMPDDAQSAFIADSFGIANSAFLQRRARGTAASPSAVQSGDNLGFIGGAGFKATVYSTNQVGMVLKAAGNWTDTSAPTDITLETTPSGSVSRAEVLRVLAAGNIKLTNPANFSANGSVATSLGSVGPAGSHTTVQKWLTIVDNTGATLYLPAF